MIKKKSNPFLSNLFAILTFIVPVGVLFTLFQFLSLNHSAIAQSFEFADDFPAQDYYFNDFEGEIGSEWSNTSTSTTPLNIRRFLGEFNNDFVYLSLNSLPAHTVITVTFDLFIIRSWDGNTTEYKGGPVGPDIWDLQLLGGITPLLHTSFSNWDTLGFYQAYPDSYPDGNYFARTGATENNSLGYTNSVGEIMDSVYHLSFTFPHSSNDLTFIFSSYGLQEIFDESWGLDNVSVSGDFSDTSLNLPFPHEPSDNGINLINSYFDHQYPLGITKSSCEPLEAQNSVLDFRGPPAKSDIYYSVHDGYDFDLELGADVLAATSGNITWGYDSPSLYSCPLRGGYMTHTCMAKITNEDYQTVYIHLEKIGGTNQAPVCKVGSGEVEAGDVIGQVGLTGCTTGSHLHFEARYSPVFGFNNDTKVDPYFSFLPGQIDPWASSFTDSCNVTHPGVTSTWLWEFDRPQQNLATASLGTQLYADWGISVDVPGSALSSNAWVGVTISPEPDILTGTQQLAGNSILTVPAGQATWLSAVYTDGVSLTSFQEPITITYVYTDSDIQYADEATLAIYQFNEAGQTWVGLPGTLDLNTQTIWATTTMPGVISLRGEPIYPSPQILSITPNTGSNREDTQITITGIGFMPTSVVHLGPYSLESDFISPTTLTVIIPEGLWSGTYYLEVKNPDSQFDRLQNAFVILFDQFIPFILK